MWEFQGKGSLLELFEDDGMLLAKINASQWEDYSHVTPFPKHPEPTWELEGLVFKAGSALRRAVERTHGWLRAGFECRLQCSWLSGIVGFCVEWGQSSGPARGCECGSILYTVTSQCGCEWLLNGPSQRPTLLWGRFFSWMLMWVFNVLLLFSTYF